MEYSETANKILDTAEHYTQTRGFNAFSYRDIQRELGIKTSSIHYHFPTKQDLALHMIERYLETYKASLSKIKSAQTSSLQKLQSLANLFVGAVKKGDFCLCGMMATDIATIPGDVEKRLHEFFEFNEKWVANVIRQGIAVGEIKDSVNTKNASRQYVAMLEGGMLIARVRKSGEYLQAVVKETLKQLKS